MKNLNALTLCLLAVACGRPQQGADGTTSTSSGRVVIQNKGSDTLVNVAQAWAEAYKTVDANVAIAVTGGGSGTGISSMINGTVDIQTGIVRLRFTTDPLDVTGAASVPVIAR